MAENPQGSKTELRLTVSNSFLSSVIPVRGPWKNKFKTKFGTKEESEVVGSFVLLLRGALTLRGQFPNPAGHSLTLT